MSNGTEVDKPVSSPLGGESAESAESVDLPEAGDLPEAADLPEVADLPEEAAGQGPDEPEAGDISDAGDVPALPEEPRQLTDARELRALTHPIRLSLLEVLSMQGALTATEAGELIGESPTTCSFHLRQLAKYGFVEEAGGGTGRRRPWRVAQRGIQFSSSASDNPELAVAATALEGLLYRRWFDRLEQWDRVRFTEPEIWQQAADASESVLHLTAEEVMEVVQEMRAVQRRFSGRSTDPSLRPEGSRPVEFVSFVFPVQMGQSPVPRPTPPAPKPPTPHNDEAE